MTLVTYFGERERGGGRGKDGKRERGFNFWCDTAAQVWKALEGNTGALGCVALGRKETDTAQSVVQGLLRGLRRKRHLSVYVHAHMPRGACGSQRITPRN